jgi:hypothetical protein
VKFEPIPFSNFGDTNLHAKFEPKCDADAEVDTIAFPILGIVELEIKAFKNTCIRTM